MNLPALLIEYLISGGVAALWIIPLASLFGISIREINLMPLASLLVIPFLYVTGLLLDMICAYLLGLFGIKAKIRSDSIVSFRKAYDEPEQIDLASLYIWKHSPDLGKEYDRRSSRDRIARTTALNCALSAAVLPIASLKSGASIYLAGVSCLVSAALAVAFYFIWRVCEQRSFEFKLRANHVVRTSPPESP